MSRCWRTGSHRGLLFFWGSSCVVFLRFIIIIPIFTFILDFQYFCPPCAPHFTWTTAGVGADPAVARLEQKWIEKALSTKCLALVRHSVVYSSRSRCTEVSVIRWSRKQKVTICDSVIPGSHKKRMENTKIKSKNSNRGQYLFESDTTVPAAAFSCPLNFLLFWMTEETSHVPYAKPPFWYWDFSQSVSCTTQLRRRRRWRRRWRYHTRSRAKKLTPKNNRNQIYKYVVVYAHAWLFAQTFK